VAVCFANLGTTELPIVAALDRGAGMRVVLKLLDPKNLGRALAAFTPKNAIIVNEAATAGSAWSALHTSSAAMHTVLGLTLEAPSATACPRHWALRAHARTGTPSPSRLTKAVFAP